MSGPSLAKGPVIESSSLTKLRIAQVCPLYPPHGGGVEYHVKEISERLAKTNDVDILTTDPTGVLPRKELVNDIQILRFRSFAPGGDAYFFSPKLYNYLKKHSKEYDIVHAHNYPTFPAYYAAVSKACNKFVLTPHFHGTIAAGTSFIRKLLHVPYRRWLGMKIFEKADKVLCCNEWEENIIRHSFGNLNEKLVRIKEPPLLDNLHQLKSKRLANRDKKIILCVSRIVKYKGIQYIIKALPYLPSFVHLHIVGKGPFKPIIEKLIRQLKLEHRVVFSQDLSKEEMLKCYMSADVGVLLSLHEQYGLFIAEALASGMPCVVANKTALSEWIDGKNCVGVNNPIRVEEVVLAILSVLDGRVADVKVPSLYDYVKELQNLYTMIYE